MEEPASLPPPGSSTPVTPQSSAVPSPVQTPTQTPPSSATNTPSPAVKSGRRMPILDPRNLIPIRRSSTRSIKRKKFDDEVVESSLVKSDRGRIKITPPQPEKQEPVVPEEKAPAPPQPEKKKEPPKRPVGTKTMPTKSSSSKRNKKQKTQAPASTKDLGRWKAQDDLALITAVQQTNDLTGVYQGVKFSCRFTLKEIQERWYALLYDPVISKLAIQAMKMLHPDVAGAVQAQALYSTEEEKLLGKIPSNTQPQPTLEVFEDLLDKTPDIFHPARTAKSLHSHWLLMKQYHLLPDQSVQPMPRGDHVLNLSDAEDMLNDDDLKDGRDEILEHELAIADKRNKREIRHLEQELPKWQVQVDSITGINPQDFDNQTLAVLKGRLVRYLMRSREITLGRATKDNQIDVDLSLEGPAAKISRRQGVIKLRNNGDFFIANEGKRPIYIDGKPVLAGNKQKLFNNSVLEISCLRFTFLMNQDLINVIRAEAQKITPPTT
ncbi:microspherule protein 1-like [Haliotis asinina]|uniref:microspherule protein 1-like n=1 Tax=Haliotis asinina TaxID=109174 RepID=UPI003531BA0A